MRTGSALSALKKITTTTKKKNKGKKNNLNNLLNNFAVPLPCLVAFITEMGKKYFSCSKVWSVSQLVH